MFAGGCTILGQGQLSVVIAVATLTIYLGMSCGREPEPPKISPVGIAEKHVSEHIESYSDDLAKFVTRGLPVVKDILGDQIERQVRENAEWRFVQTDTLGGGRFQVTAVAAVDVPLDIEVPDIEQHVTGYIRAGVPFYIEVDHKAQVVIDTVVDYDRAVLDVSVNGLEEAVKQKALQVGAGVAGAVVDKANEFIDQRRDAAEDDLKEITSDLWKRLPK